MLSVELTPQSRQAADPKTVLSHGCRISPNRWWGGKARQRNGEQTIEGGAVPYGAREEHDVEEEFARSGAEAAVCISLSPRRPGASHKAEVAAAGADGTAEGSRRRHDVSLKLPAAEQMGAPWEEGDGTTSTAGRASVTGWGGSAASVTGLGR